MTFSRDEPKENNNSINNDDELSKKKKNIGDENTRISLNDINQLKNHVKSLGITFTEMTTISVRKKTLHFVLIHMHIYIFFFKEYLN